VQVIGGTNVAVEHISIDSRSIRPMSLFVAIPGTTVDGHQYIPQCIKQGAIAIVCERMPEELHPGVTYVQVNDSSEALGYLSCNFYDHPSEKIRNSVYEICEFLVDVLKVKSLTANFPHKIGLHQSCHGQRGLRLSSMTELNEAPFSKLAQLLDLVNGVEYVYPERADECCGFGGTFCVTEEAVSVRMGQDRVESHLKNEIDTLGGLLIKAGVQAN
jgi:hypothetical protein